MRIKKIKVYQFKELNERAKEKAINWYKELNHGDSFTWDNTREDAKEVGLELKGTNRGYMMGNFIDSAISCADKILLNHGESCETYKTAKKFKEAYKKASKTVIGFDESEEREELEEEFKKSILEDYRIMQEKDEEYENSEENIIENIEVNEYEFDENGKRV